MSFSVEGIPINVTKFPDNTSQVWKVSEWIVKDHIIPEIVWDFESEGEIVQLAMLVDLFKSNPINAGVRLFINYLPYARQDKKISNETTFALHSFAKLLNSLEFSSIKILDPHSEIALDLIKNSKAIKPLDYINKTIQQVKTDVLVFPDMGAYTKYKMVGFDVPKIYAEKTRNQLTGELSGCKINGGVKDKVVLIVDDICDGGGTFINLAKALYDSGAKEVNLYVTHGIFSKGPGVLFDANIKRIFTKDGQVFNRNELVIYKPWENFK